MTEEGSQEEDISVQLTGVERTALLFASVGLSAKQIVAAVNTTEVVTERTIVRRLDRAKKKLHAGNITHACVRALVHDVISTEEIERLEKYRLSD